MQNSDETSTLGNAPDCRILMVCLGNICRSPIAQGVFENLSKKLGFDAVVDSAGTGAWHVGEAPDRRAVQTAKNRGIDISKQRARQFNVNDFDAFDLILAMDQSNERDIRNMARDAQDLSKVNLFLRMAQHNEELSVPDPYYGGPDGFEEVFDLIEAASEAIIKNLKGI
ncbi:MAG TPA: low molecular weight protein-tyrosine-phosphatase [Bacteroidia bacterium]|nr:low molecular weight protein-tyrosine-phosphatase [Bacteroidia bacterium]HNT80268.1 low molecular weight protein-tyrosine-phosphatase [Bacteroidia bacterium]